MSARYDAGRHARPGRRPMALTFGMCTALSALCAGSSAAVAACPTSAGPDAVQVDRMVDTRDGALTARFAGGDRPDAPGPFCAELDYTQPSGTGGRLRHVETAASSSHSVSLFAAGVLMPKDQVALASTRRTDAAGRRETEFSQRLALAELEQKARWVRNAASDTLTFGGRTAPPGAAATPVAIAGSASVRRDRTSGTMRLSGIDGRVDAALSNFRVTIGHTGSVGRGKRGGWNAGLTMRPGRAAPPIQHVVLGVVRSTDRRTGIDVRIEAAVAGHKARVTAETTRTGDWRVGAEWHLIDGPAGDLSLDVDVDHREAATEGALLLSGALSW